MPPLDNEYERKLKTCGVYEPFSTLLSSVTDVDRRKSIEDSQLCFRNSGVWYTIPSICRVVINSTGAGEVSIDTQTIDGITSNSAFVYTLTSPTANDTHTYSSNTVIMVRFSISSNCTVQLLG
jgi:hypothetical protein